MRDLNIRISVMEDNQEALQKLTIDGTIGAEDDVRHMQIARIEDMVSEDFESGMGFLRHIDELIAMRSQQTANDSFLKTVLQ
jgi:hypothetical protein